MGQHYTFRLAVTAGGVDQTSGIIFFDFPDASININGVIRAIFHQLLPSDDGKPRGLMDGL